LEEALQSCETALQAAPNFVDALNTRGIALHRLNRREEALACYDLALRTQPGHAETLTNRGHTLRAMQRLDDALACYGQALRVKPNDVELLAHQGGALLALKRPQEALASYAQALQLQPSHVGSLNGAGIALHHLKRLPEALASYTRALQIEPGNIESLNGQGVVLHKLRRREEALASYERALQIRPGCAETINHRGIALHELNRIGEALDCYAEALRIMPDYVEAHCNRGVALHNLNRPEEALESYFQALRLQPDSPDAHWNEGLAYLLMGDLGRGWQQYEWRWQADGFPSPKRDFTQPLWLGQESLRGKTILLHAEQGLGDTLQFCRYVQLVAALCENVLLEVHPPLKALLSQLPGVGQVIAKGEPLPDFDCHCPLLSLPLAFNTTLDTIPTPSQYLCAEPARIDAWRAKLGAERRPPRIGLAWSGSTGHTNDHNRSIPLADMFGALAPAGQAQWISIQKEVRAADEPVLQAHPEIAHYGEDLTDFGETAALIANLDWVISVDTSVAHLAAAMGKPVWLLLPFSPDWRWLLDRTDSPWYPGMRLFRQSAIGDWGSVLAEVAAHVAPATE
ncbi:MAG: tetratricopeptide repeat protein, partial [Candidatus Methylumidiphilus sp.]